MTNRLFVKITLILLSVLCFFLYLTTFIFPQRYDVIQEHSGKLDASTIPSNTIINIQGNWRFYPYSDSLSLDPPSNSYLSPTGSWNHIPGISSQQPALGYGLYTINMTLAHPGTYGIRFDSVFSAYKLYINGIFLMENGTFSTDPHKEVGSAAQRYTTFYTDQDHIQIQCLVSNSHNIKKGGLSNFVLFGTSDLIVNNYYRDLINSTFLIGIFVGLGIFLLLMYRLDHRNYLYLSLICFSAAIIEATYDHLFIYYLFPTIPYALLCKIEYMGFILGMIGFLLFTTHLFLQPTSWLRILKWIDYTYLIMVILLPYTIFAYNDRIYITILVLNTAACLYTLLRSIRHHWHAALILFGTLIMGITIWIDYRFVNGYGSLYLTRHSCGLGILFFITCHLFVMSDTIYVAFKKSSFAKDMEIAYLQAQISPHFIFNILGSIQQVMGHSPEKANLLIVKFSDFLRARHKFDYRHHITCPLSEELSLSETYVHLQNHIHSDMILLNIAVPDELANVPVPRLILQPLLENAIKHGLTSPPLHITIHAAQFKEYILITVSDNGPGIAPQTLHHLFEPNTTREGIGLINVNERLKQNYGTKLHITSNYKQGTQIHITIPAKEDYA